ncbi:MAG: hypothetical protein AAGC63_03765 [Propionicimonas sp.]|nr:hypothetical protein [Propionicimonas sp.]
MTALLAPKPERRAPQRPNLRPVLPPRRQMRTAGFVAVVAVVLGLGMVGVLILTTMLQDKAFDVQRRQSEATALANQLSDLKARASAARSVQSLAVAAQKLGMKPNPYPVQLRLPDGKVVGEESKVMGGEVPSVRYITEEQAGRELQARHDAEARRKAEAEAKKKAEAEAKQKAEAEKQAKAEAKKKAQEQAAQGGADQ